MLNVPIHDNQSHSCLACYLSNTDHHLLEHDTVIFCVKSVMLTSGLLRVNLPGWAAAGHWVTFLESQRRTSGETWCGIAEMKSWSCCWMSGKDIHEQEEEGNKVVCYCRIAHFNVWNYTITEKQSRYNIQKHQKAMKSFSQSAKEHQEANQTLHCKFFNHSCTWRKNVHFCSAQYE